MANGSTPPGWYQDPTGQGESRYWNGSSWTQTVSRGGVTIDVPIDPAKAELPPVPGTQMQAPVPPAQPVQPTTVVQQGSSHSPLGTIVGVVLAILAVVVILAFIGNATSEDESPTPGTGTLLDELRDRAPADESSDEGSSEDGG